MAKIVALMIVLLVINVSLFVFNNNCDLATNKNVNNASMTCENNTIQDFAKGVYNLDDVPLVGSTWNYLLLAAGAGIILAVAFFRSEFPVYAAVGAALMLTCLSMVVNIFQVMNNSLGILYATIIVGPIALYTLFVWLDWARTPLA